MKLTTPRSVLVAKGISYCLLMPFAIVAGLIQFFTHKTWNYFPRKVVYHDQSKPLRATRGFVLFPTSDLIWGEVPGCQWLTFAYIIQSYEWVGKTGVGGYHWVDIHATVLPPDIHDLRKIIAAHHVCSGLIEHIMKLAQVKKEQQLNLLAEPTSTIRSQTVTTTQS